MTSLCTCLTSEPQPQAGGPNRSVTFSLIGFQNLHGMNGLKNLLSAVLSLVSVTTYVTACLIAWESATILAISTTIGGYIGAQQARRIQHTEYLLALIVGVGASMTLVFFAI